MARKNEMARRWTRRGRDPEGQVMSINRVEPEQKRRKDTPAGPVPRMRMRGAEFMTGDFFAGGIKRREKGGAA